MEDLRAGTGHRLGHLTPGEAGVGPPAIGIQTYSSMCMENGPVK